MRRLVVLAIATVFLLGAEAPGGCRAPWNPPEPVVPEAKPRPPHPGLAEPFAGRPLSHWVDKLENGTDGERKDAAYKLGRAGEKAWVAIPDLIRALDDDSDFGVRSLAAQSLGEIGPVLREVIPALERALREDDHVAVRTSASKALARNGVVPETE